MDYADAKKITRKHGYRLSPPMCFGHGNRAHYRISAGLSQHGPYCGLEATVEAAKFFGGMSDIDGPNARTCVFEGR